MNDHDHDALRAPNDRKAVANAKNELVSRYVSDFPNNARDIKVFTPFFLESDSEDRIRKFIVSALEFPATEEGEARLLSLFSSTGGILTDETLVPEFSGSERGIVAETVRLLWDIREFGSGFHKHPGIAFWKQIRDAIQECSESEDPNAEWESAIKKRSLPKSALDDSEFMDSYYEKNSRE